MSDRDRKDDTGARLRWQMSEMERDGARRARPTPLPDPPIPEPSGPENEITPPPVSLSLEGQVIWEHVNQAERRSANLAAAAAASAASSGGLAAAELVELRDSLRERRFLKRIVALVGGAALAALGSGLLALYNAGQRDGRNEAERAEVRRDLDRHEKQFESVWAYLRLHAFQPPKETP